MTATSWATIGFYAVVFLLSLRLLLPVILYLFTPSLRIGSLSPFGLGNIVWTPPWGGERSEERVRIEVGRVSVSILGSKSSAKGWFVLKLSRVRIVVPRAAVLAVPNRPEKSKKNGSAKHRIPRDPQGPPKSPHGIARRLAWFIQRRLIHPAVFRVNKVVSTLTSALVLFAVSVDFTLEVEQTLSATGVLSAGVEVGGALRPPKDSSLPDDDLTTRLGVWVGLSNLNVLEWQARPDIDVVARPTGALLPALTLKEQLVVSMSAPLGPRHGLLSLIVRRGKNFAMTRSSVRVAVELRQSKTATADDMCAHVRVYELARVTSSVEALARERKDTRPSAENSGEGEQAGARAPSDEVSPLVYLRSIELTIPSFMVSAHYTTPLHILAASPKRPLPQSVSFAGTIRGLYGKLLLGGRSELVKREHLHWLGKGRTLGLGGRLFWEELEGRVKIDGHEHDVPPHSSKAFSIGSSSLHVTSTFVPPQLVPTVTKTSLIPCDHNDKTLVVEGHLGPIRGHATFETFDSALRIFKARPRKKIQDQPRKESQSVPAHLTSLPRVIGVIELDGLELRIQAPMNTSESFDQDDPFFRSWSSPELICISVPNACVSLGGEYSDRSVRRSEVDRRTAKRLAKRDQEELEARESLEQSQSTTSPSAAFERDFDVPPPPPVTKPMRRHKPARPDSSLSRDLDLYTLRYSARVNVISDALNVYILATSPNTAQSDEEETCAWLNDKVVLPSDPVRFDILAIGPLEVCSKHAINGWEDEEDAIRIRPVLDAPTHEGTLNILVETVQADLWRPVVMGCLRDFVSSFASASATSTLRTPSSLPTPDLRPMRPLVDLLPPDLLLYVAVASFDMRVAGSDPKNDEQACRGIAIHCGPVVSEFLLRSKHKPDSGNVADRHALEMREDIRVEANAHLAQGNVAKQALVKVSLSSLNIDPVVNARASRGHVRRQSHGTGRAADEEDEADVWELKNRSYISDLVKRRRSILPTGTKDAVEGILSIPQIAFRVRIERAPDSPMQIESRDVTDSLDMFTVSVESDKITLRVELLGIYLCLVAVSALRSLSPKSPMAPRMQPPPSDPNPRSGSRPKPILQLRAEVADVNAFVTLPHRVNLFLHVRRLRIQFAQKTGTLVKFDNALLAGESPTMTGKWDDIARMRIVALEIRPEPNNAGHQPFVVSFTSESARLRIPFRYVLSRIIDNIATLVKAVKQLVHQHVKGGLDFIIEPHIEEAKKLPEIKIQIKMFVIEIQDDPFETRLNIIWRAGCEEQNARLERATAFKAKVEAIRKAESGASEEHSSSDDVDETTGHPSAARKPNVSAKHSVSIHEARQALRAYNSSHWIKRMRNAVAEQGRREEALTRRLYGLKHLSHRPDPTLPIDLLPPSRSVPLARGMLHDLRLDVTRTSFADEKLPDFLHDVGKGLPRDTQFSLLIPIHLTWKMEEARLNVRDYPLPLLHVPPMSQNAGHEHASWEWKSDLVIAEEIGGHESVREIPTEIVPAHIGGHKNALYSMVVPRSAMTTKTYCTPTVTIRSPFPTRIGWGNSISPAIQDITKVMDTFTKATPDPSEKIGIWDKLRLQFHWRVRVQFQGEGPVHFHLKGSRDPYVLHGFGAGFAKSWHGNVRFLIGLDNPDREFFQILSDSYVLGIPNLRDYIDSAATGLGTRDPLDTSDASTQHSGGTSDLLGRYRAVDQQFTKVCAKFINGVRWGMGIVLERACGADCSKASCHDKSPFHRQCRIFDFIPHWKVHTKTAASIGPQGEFEDSFAGFRSDFIHFSISLTSPLTLSLPSNPSSSTPTECHYDGRDGYNSLHFTPEALTHFKRWWRLFDGTMSLPIRRGKLFPSAVPPSKKFGKHCATIKYRFSLAPLFISHTYRQDLWEEWDKGETSCIGVKGKIGRFNVDLHQREQEMPVVNPDTGERKTVMHKAFYMAEIDLDSVDLRVLTALFKEPEKAIVVPGDGEENGNDSELPSADYYVRGQDENDWFDLDDFVDALYTIDDPEPQMRVLPFIVSPRFTYYRHVDAASKVGASDPMDRSASQGGKESKAGREHSADSHEPATGEGSDRAKTKFGQEPSHTCLMGCSTDTVTVQIQAAETRLAELEAEAESLRHVDQSRSKELGLRITAVRRIIERLVKVRDRYEDRLPEDEAEMQDKAQEAKAPRPQPPYGSVPRTQTGQADAEDDGDDDRLPHITSEMFQLWGMWENRYMIHNPTIQISNLTREILLKYYYSSSIRRGLLYHLSASAVKFIRDLAKEHDAKERKTWSRRKSTRTNSAQQNQSQEKEKANNKLLDQLAQRGKGTPWALPETETGRATEFAKALEVDPDHAADDLPDDYELNSGHLCMFIKPQIALKSDLDDASTIILTAFRAQLKVFSVTDTKVADDPVNSQVVHQTFAVLDGLQVFYPREPPRGGRMMGQGADSVFVPLETMVDLRVEPWGFDRVVPRFSAALRYDKFNRLRMSSKNDNLDDGQTQTSQTQHFATGTDRIAIECDKFSVSANPDHFKAIYNVVTDLLLYSDPNRKAHNSKLEAVVFTGNFSNLMPAIDMILNLQQRYRSQIALQMLYEIHNDELDESGRIELFESRSEAKRLAEQLSLVVESITRAQDINGASKMSGSTAGIQFETRASELVWHMLDSTDTPFAKFSVSGAEFSWVSKQDSSTSNRLIIRDLKALNSSPEHIFAEIIAKNERIVDHELAHMDIFAAILWDTLSPVGGILIVEQLELHLRPLKLQLEHRVGRQILDYLFAQRRQQKNQDQSDSKSSSTAGTPASTRPPSIRVMAAGVNKSTESLGQSSMNDGKDSHRTSQTLHRGNRSSPNLASSASSVHGSERGLRKMASAEVLNSDAIEQGLDAEEMRRRAALNKAFILIDVNPTVLCLTYRSEKEDHSRLPDVYNITYKTPSVQYRSKTWSYLDLLNELKKDTIRSVWSQKGALIGQLLQTAHRKLPLTDVRAAAKRNLKSSIRARLHFGQRAPPIELHPSSPLAREPSDSSSVDAQSARLVNPSPSSSLADDSDSSDLEELADSQIPFDVDDSHLLGLASPFTEEPEKLPSDASSRSSSKTGVGSSAQLSRHDPTLPAESHSLPPPRQHTRIADANMPKHSISLPPANDPRRVTANEENDGAPPARRASRPALEGKSAESKAHLLLGKSFE